MLLQLNGFFLTNKYVKLLVPSFLDAASRLLYNNIFNEILFAVWNSAGCLSGKCQPRSWTMLTYSFHQGFGLTQERKAPVRI